MVRMEISYDGRDESTECDAVFAVLKIKGSGADHSKTVLYGDASPVEMLAMLGSAVGSVYRIFLDEIGMSPATAQMYVLRSVSVGLVLSKGSIRVDDGAARGEIERIASSLGIDIPDGGGRR